MESKGSTLTKIPNGLEEIRRLIGDDFARTEARDNADHYLKALLDHVERKNCWQMAEAAGQSNPYGMQRVISSSHWDPDKVRDDLRSYVVQRLGDPKAVLVVDETGFLKKGNKSAGVQRQYSGTAGKIENCQIGVFLAYAARKGTAFIDRELYLPQEWAGDSVRRAEAGIPEEVTFAKKSELAQKMLKRAFEEGVPCRWVTADEVYGNDRELRRWLEQEKHSYVLAISSNQYVWWHGLRQRQVGTLVKEVAEEDWQRLSAGDGAKGPRIYDWAILKLPPIGPVLPSGWGRWLIIRRSIDKPEEKAYFVAAGPERTRLPTLVRVVGQRWKIEIAFEEAKGETGLDEYEVRKWGGWYRHITLSLLAHAYLAVVRSYRKKGAKD